MIAIDVFAVMQGHEEDVNAVAWSADGQSIASGANDQTIRVWDVAAGTCIATLPVSRSTLALARLKNTNRRH